MKRETEIITDLLCGFPSQQIFLNLCLDDCVEEKTGGEKVRIGTVVIRGNSVVMLEVRKNWKYSSSSSSSCDFSYNMSYIIRNQED